MQLLLQARQHCNSAKDGATDVHRKRCGKYVDYLRLLFLEGDVAVFKRVIAFSTTTYSVPFGEKAEISSDSTCKTARLMLRPSRWVRDGNLCI